MHRRKGGWGYLVLSSIDFPDTKGALAVYFVTGGTSMYAFSLMLAEHELALHVLKAELAKVDEFLLVVFFRVRRRIPRVDDVGTKLDLLDAGEEFDGVDVVVLVLGELGECWEGLASRDVFLEQWTLGIVSGGGTTRV